MGGIVGRNVGAVPDGYVKKTKAEKPPPDTEELRCRRRARTFNRKRSSILFVFALLTELRVLEGFLQVSAVVALPWLCAAHLQ